MKGPHSELVASIRQKVTDSKNCPLLMAFHCIIHQQRICATQLNLKHIKTVVVKLVNFIKSRALNHRIFKEFFKKIKCEHVEVLYFSEVCWLSRGKVLKRFFALRHDFEIFRTEKLNPIPKFSEPIWLWKLAILFDLMQYLNDLI